MPKQTKKCPYCEGKGYNVRHEFDGSWRYPCIDCKKTGQVCILCIKPSSLCECPESAFDDVPDYTGMDRPKPNAG